jgi:hypothetical protein
LILFRGLWLAIILIGAAKLEQVIEGGKNIGRVAIVHILRLHASDGRDQLFGRILFGFLLAIVFLFAIIGVSPEPGEKEETGMSGH